ncbi:class I SAM-dependent methyltransferase [Oxynema sp. CENA135]|jgi:16S rRNA G966 N2-methylase RsmD|uniref:class I SAM-dependent methyltransferase n=1 Tax=Oxynema sp. CENA135 TaxID=984206 RepID=UPI00190E1B2D|nr:class I SAM-dependent methyltransferase [Oxynema sp. CENA135]MBK4728710.1 class I SAM-dependent methyltransferase [Oxynema sp. CENA135]
MQDFINKVIKGNKEKHRKTRFHDEKGNLITLDRFLSNGPKAAFTKAQSIMSTSILEVPQIPYTAAKTIQKYLHKNSIVLEFGSGRSTIWLAKQCATIYSVDDNEYWFNRVQEKLKLLSLNNVVYEFRPRILDYVNFPSDYNLSFDLIFIDGTWRQKCLENSINQLNPGGIIYIDDTDKHIADIKQTEKLVRNIIHKKGGELIEFTDFSPEQLFVKQGILAKIP